MTVSILKAVVIITILGVMVLLLLGISHLFSGQFNSTKEDADHLREEVKESSDVISDNSVFRDLVKKPVGKGELPHSTKHSTAH